MFAPEGIWLIAVPAVLFALFAFLAVWKKKRGWFVLSGFFMLVFLFMLFFFRDPVRPIPDPSAIVSPADGTVAEVEIDSTGRTRIAIFLSLLNVHAIRAPISSTVVHSEYIPGRFLRADKAEAGIVNQRVQALLSTPYGPVVLKAISGAVARRVVVPLKKGQKLFAGERIGFVRFGSRAEITFPPGFDVSVKVGDKVYGAVTELGKFAEKTAQQEDGAGA